MPYPLFRIIRLCACASTPLAEAGRPSNQQAQPSQAAQAAQLGHGPTSAELEAAAVACFSFAHVAELRSNAKHTFGTILGHRLSASATEVAAEPHKRATPPWHNMTHRFGHGTSCGASWHNQGSCCNSFSLQTLETTQKSQSSCRGFESDMVGRGLPIMGQNARRFTCKIAERTPCLGTASPRGNLTDMLQDLPLPKACPAWSVLAFTAV